MCHYHELDVTVCWCTDRVSFQIHERSLSPYEERITRLNTFLISLVPEAFMAADQSTCQHVSYHPRMIYSGVPSTDLWFKQEAAMSKEVSDLFWRVILILTPVMCLSHELFDRWSKVLMDLTTTTEIGQPISIVLTKIPKLTM